MDGGFGRICSSQGSGSRRRHVSRPATRCDEVSLAVLFSLGFHQAQNDEVRRRKSSLLDISLRRQPRLTYYPRLEFSSADALSLASQQFETANCSVVYLLLR